MPFNEEINDTFVSEKNLHVYAGNALHLNFSFPSVTYEDDDYPMVITLTNVSDITLYNVHNLFVIKENAVSTVAPTCTNEGYTTYSCLCGEHTHTEITSPKTEHSYNGDGVCEACGNEKEDFRDENEECTCKCHRRGIGAFFWKIGEFFRRLFGKRHVCDCANAILCAFTKETLGTNLN